VTVRVAIDEVQANVLFGYKPRYDHALHLRLKVGDPAGAREALARWNRAGAISFGNMREARAPAHVNVAFTYTGLRKLQLPRAFLDAFPAEFRLGARCRAHMLGDVWLQWDEKRSVEERYEDCHVLVSIQGTSPQACEKQRGALRIPSSLSQVAERKAASTREWQPSSSEVEHSREHFGFADGRSQPAIEGVDLDPVGDGVYAGLHPANGALRRRLGRAAENMGLRPIARSWRHIRPGEFLLGYDNEDGERSTGPPEPFGPDGTFMVYREIDQFKDHFDRYVEDEARRHGMSRAELEAKIVGRWKDDGTPAAQVPDEPGIAEHRRRANDFRYEGDAHGFGCPLGAHVRRANPRDALPGGAERTMRHRIIRRGMPYAVPDGADQQHGGLVFICFSASIANGFEFIQREWINRGDAFGLGREPDFLLQQPDPADGKLTGRLVIQGYRPIVLKPPEKPFVTVRGCEYLFVPSRRALTWLSQLEPAT
jgi:Dyp-type peroxidase family